MQEFLKKGTIMNIISTLLFLILGVILVVAPNATLNIITYLVEIILIIWGIITIVNYIRVQSKHDVFSLGFVQAVACILIALFLIINPKLVVTILPICIGAWMILGSLARIQVAIKLSAWGQKTSAYYIFLYVLMFSIGLIILCNPFKTAELIVQMLGIGLVVYCVFDIVQNIYTLRFLNKID